MSELTARSDITVHELTKATRDRKSQPGSTKFPHGCRCRLREIIKHNRELIRRHPDPRICNNKFELFPTVEAARPSR